jgi:hypothetical protein
LQIFPHQNLPVQNPSPSDGMEGEKQTEVALAWGGWFCCVSLTLCGAQEEPLLSGSRPGAEPE